MANKIIPITIKEGAVSLVGLVLLLDPIALDFLLLQLSVIFGTFIITLVAAAVIVTIAIITTTIAAIIMAPNIHLISLNFLSIIGKLPSAD
jgi:hypothetical protein